MQTDTTYKSRSWDVYVSLMKDNYTYLSLAPKLMTLTVNASPQLAQVENDTSLIRLWLHGKSPCTQRSYGADVRLFLDFVVGKPLSGITLADIQAWDMAMEEQGKAPATRARRLGAVKSLFSYGCKIGALKVNVGLPITTPAVKDTIAEKIFTEAQWFRLIMLEPNTQYQLMLQMLYETRARVSEFCQLKWRDIREKGDETAGVTLFGKGGKTRTVTITPELWSAIEATKGNAGLSAPMFKSKRGSHYSTVQVWRIVKTAGERAGIQNLSPHWLRHSGATHQLMNGSPIHLQQRELGHAGLDITSRYLHLIPGEYGAKYTKVRLPSQFKGSFL